ncbi:MAG: biotin--[acetyl-CoA-carboxylase] ligase, partial [Ramlibacter sp.]
MTDALRERWGLPDLQHELQQVEPGLTLEVVASIGSTNTALLERAGAARAAATALANAGPGGQDAWTSRLLVAQAQTQGRGRQGRAWHAQPGS